MEGRYWLWLGARLLFAVVIVGWAASYLIPGGSGEREFQKTLDAMKQVRTVRVSTVTDASATQHLEMSWDLVCAQDAYHFKWHLVESDPDRAANVNREEIHVGSTSYEHRPDDSWKPAVSAVGPKTATAICGMLAQGTDSQVLPDIATMIRRGILDKGDKKTVNGVGCREWKIAMKGAPSGLEHDTVCLGLDDHLPYEMTVDWRHSRTTYSDYNTPFQVNLPAAALQPASANPSRFWVAQRFSAAMSYKINCGFSRR